MSTNSSPIDYPLEQDCETLLLKFTGGTRAWRLDADAWRIDPIAISESAYISQVLSQTEMNAIIQDMGLAPVIFEHRLVRDGAVSVILEAAVGRSGKPAISPAAKWANISINATKERMQRIRKYNPTISKEELIVAKEKRTALENYARFISNSLHSMSFCASAICDYYHAQLVEALLSKRPVGTRFSNLSDAAFVANLHSFFLHFGSVRDYLAALIAIQCSFKGHIDSMNRLIDKLKWQELPGDPIVQRLVDLGLFAPKAGSNKKLQLSGWLASASEDRNRLKHRQPFGAYEQEKFGQIDAIGGNAERLRFWRPLVGPHGSNTDALDRVSEVYGRTLNLFAELTEVSAWRTGVPVIDDGDISSAAKQK